MKYNELVHFIKENVVLDDVELVIEENKVVLKQKTNDVNETNAYDMDTYDLILSIVRIPDYIKKIGNGWEINAEKFGNAYKLWQTLSALIGSDYKIEIPSTYTVRVVKAKDGDLPNNVTNPSVGNADFKWKKESFKEAKEMGLADGIILLFNKYANYPKDFINVYYKMWKYYDEIGLGEDFAKAIRKAIDDGKIKIDIDKIKDNELVKKTGLVESVSGDEPKNDVNEGNGDLYTEIASFIDNLGFKVDIEILNDKIVVVGDPKFLEEIAMQVDKKYPNSEIILNKKNLEIKPK